MPFTVVVYIHPDFEVFSTAEVVNFSAHRFNLFQYQPVGCVVLVEDFTTGFTTDFVVSFDNVLVFHDSLLSVGYRPELLDGQEENIHPTHQALPRTEHIGSVVFLLLDVHCYWLVFELNRLTAQVAVNSEVHRLFHTSILLFTTKTNSGSIQILFNLVAIS